MTWQNVKLVGFAPDLPEDTPGIFAYTNRVVPTDRGFGPGCYLTNLGGTANSTFLGGAVLTKVDGSRVVYLGTSSKLYDANTGSLQDQSGATYSAGFSAWSFAQFGNVTLAINKGTNLQKSTGSTFSTVSGAPKAEIVVTPSLPQLQFAMCFNYDDGVNDLQDGIFWSAGSNFADWTPSIATGCANVRVTDIGGPFTAAIPFRDGVVAFKRRAMYLGRYVGAPAIWDFERISADVGCVGKNAVVEADDVIYFADEGGIWRYDGSYPQRVPGPVHNYWATLIANTGLYATIPSLKPSFIRLTWDKQRHRLWCGVGDAVNDTNFLVFNTLSGYWTRYGTIGGVMELISPDYATQTAAVPVLFKVKWDGISAPASTMRFNVMGSASGSAQLNRVRPEWLIAPQGAFATGRVYRGRAMRSVTSANVSMTQDADGYFDVTVSDRFLQPEVTVNANTPWELSECSYDIQPAGAN
jgi:hypothetical protein